MKKRIVFVIYLATAVLLFVYRNSLLQWIEADSSWEADILLFAVAFLIAVVPAIPYGILAALLGAKYGIVSGSVINLIISSSAAVALFLLVRYTFNPEQRQRAFDIKGISRLTALFDRSPFLAVMIARMLPFIPAQVINILASVTHMKLIPFALASIVGKIPFIFAVTLFGDRLLNYLD
ncbi:TVP38/TMEM64 family protein [Cohnella herbarum]|uniref:TVP38/TMEM64 family membrane protein n=1 Tax=Cohnella herbarum TaxID=2728023 RepID=A0A7Z2VHC4_9BACL|nr:VTT domain-containing protein [Cohnella herbarum]QJD83067.1 TVP38/TMEM64 family protein [Cohnella herbarum]